MKNVIVIFTLLIPSFLFAQNSTPINDNSIGFQFDYNGEDGLTSGVRYIKQFQNANEFKLSLTSNFSTTKTARIGYNFLKIEKSKLSLHVGLDASMTWYDYSKFEQGTKRNFDVELPIELRYAFHPDFTLFGGISFSKTLHSTTEFENKDFRWSNQRIGLMYNF